MLLLKDLSRDSRKLPQVAEKSSEDISLKQVDPLQQLQLSPTNEFEDFDNFGFNFSNAHEVASPIKPTSSNLTAQKEILSPLPHEDEILFFE